MTRKNINTTIDEDLYIELKILAIKAKTNANDLIEEGMRYVIKKYSDEMIKNEMVKDEKEKENVN